MVLYNNKGGKKKRDNGGGGGGGGSRIVLISQDIANKRSGISGEKRRTGRTTRLMR